MLSIQRHLSRWSQGKSQNFGPVERSRDHRNAPGLPFKWGIFALRYGLRWNIAIWGLFLSKGWFLDFEKFRSKDWQPWRCKEIHDWSGTGRYDDLTAQVPRLSQEIWNCTWWHPKYQEIIQKESSSDRNLRTCRKIYRKRKRSWSQSNRSAIWSLNRWI